MKYLSILRDSFRETLDRKSLYFLLSVSTLIILICGSFGFEKVGLDETVRSLVSAFDRHHALVGFEVLHRGYDITYEVTDVRTSGPEPGFEEFEGGATFRLEARPLPEFQELVLFHAAVTSRKIKSRADPIPGMDDEGKKVISPPDDETMVRFLKAKMSGANLPRSKIVLEKVDGETAVFRVWFKPSRWDTLTAGHRVTILFGKWTVPLRTHGVGDVVFRIQDNLAKAFAGWAGLLVAIVVTAGFIPSMLQKGTIDLLLSKPIRRWTLLLYKYLGGLTYVFVNAAYLVVGTWLILALRSGIWNPGFLLCIPLLLFFFSALYAVSAFFGILFRSPIVAVMASVIIWLGLWVIGEAHSVVHMPGLDPPGWVTGLADTVYSVFPPLKEVDEAISWSLARSNGISPEHYLELFGVPFPKVAWGSLFGITGAWMAALLGLGCWIFSRRDY